MDWTFQPAQDRGQRACWKAAGSAGRRVPLLSPSLVSSGRHSVPGGKKTQGARKPSAVLSADVCLSVCLSSALRVCVCRHCLWSRSLLVHRSLTMGQGESTPLSLMTEHFLDVRAKAHNLSLLVKKSKLITFCSAEWPAFQGGWPP